MVTPGVARAEPGTGVDSAALSRRLLIAAALAAGIAAITYVLMVRTVLGQRFDNAALQGSLQQSVSSRLRETFFLEHIRAGTLAAVLIAIVVAGVLRGRRVLGVAAAGAAVLSVIGTDVLKNGILTRPALVANDAYQGANSYPSGHTATAIGCAMALVLLSPPSTRGLVAILAGSYSLVVAADVEAAGWHRPSDAIGATMVCFAVVCVVAAVLVRTRRTGSGRRLTHIPAFIVLSAVWIGSLIVAAYNAVRVLRFLARTAEPVTLTNALLNEAYQFSVSLTVTIVVTALIVLLLLLGSADLDEPEPPAAPAPST